VSEVLAPFVEVLAIASLAVAAFFELGRVSAAVTLNLSFSQP
jgi:hypothetical protein